MNLTLINISIIVSCGLIGYLFGSVSCGKLVAKLAGLQELPLNQAGHTSVASLWRAKHQILAMMAIVCVLLKFILTLAAGFGIIKLDYNTYSFCAVSEFCDDKGNCTSVESACGFKEEAIAKLISGESYENYKKTTTFETRAQDLAKFLKNKQYTYDAAALLCIFSFIFGTFCPLKRRRKTQ